MQLWKMVAVILYEDFMQWPCYGSATYREHGKLSLSVAMAAVAMFPSLGWILEWMTMLIR